MIWAVLCRNSINDLVRSMTSRLKISTLSADHANDTFDGLQSPEIYQYIPDTPPPDHQSLRKHYAKMETGSSIKGEKWLNWVIFEKSSEEAIGTLQSTIVMEEDAAYIAYVLFPPYWGKGYGFESVAWLMRYLEKEETVRNIVAEIDTRNTKSIELVEKHGFKKFDTLSTDEGEDYVYLKVIDQ